MTTDPLGPQAEKFRCLAAASRALTDAQIEAIEAAADADRDDPGVDAEGYALPTAGQRAYEAAVESGRWPAAEAVMDEGPGVTWSARIAVLVSDLISPEDYAALTEPWLAAFGHNPAELTERTAP
jgi:hypothetical protein